MDILINVKGGDKVRSTEKVGGVEIAVKVPEGNCGIVFPAEIEVQSDGKKQGTLYINRNNNSQWGAADEN